MCYNGHMRLNKILVAVVDDMPDVTDAYRYALEDEGFAVEVFNESRAFLQEYIRAPEFHTELDVVILDLMIDRLSGEDILKRIRENGSEVYVIVASARNEEFTKVRLLEAGADDFIDKTVSIRELVARLKSVARRIQAKDELTSTHQTLQMSEVQDTQQLNLSKRESALLEYFSLNPDVVLTKQQIELHIFNEIVDTDSNRVNMLVSRLKRKLADANSPKYGSIDLHKGVGWSLSKP